MKKLYRLFLLLVLTLVVSTIPMFAAADTTSTTESTTASDSTEEVKSATATVKVVVGNKTLYTYDVTVKDKDVTLSDDLYIEHNGSYYKFSNYKRLGTKYDSMTIDAYTGKANWKTQWEKTISVVYTAHTHKYRPGYNRIYHWKICDCGKTTNEVRHVDPAADTDKICTCGYHFNDNAELTTLWLANMQLSPRFTKDVTEYIGYVHTYTDVKSTTISARPFDAMAKVTLPNNLEIHDGINTFEIHVTAEDTVATKVYTVTALKPVKVGNAYVLTDRITVSASVKPTVKQKVASTAVSEAVFEKMLEFVAADNCKRFAICPDFSKWNVNQVEVRFTGAQMNALCEKTEADLILESPYNSVLTIPHDELTAMTEGCDSLVLYIRKDSTFEIICDGRTMRTPPAITFITDK